MLKLPIGWPRAAPALNNKKTANKFGRSAEVISIRFSLMVVPLAAIAVQLSCGAVSRNLFQHLPRLVRVKNMKLRVNGEGVTEIFLRAFHVPQVALNQPGMKKEKGILGPPGERFPHRDGGILRLAALVERPGQYVLGINVPPN